MRDQHVPNREVVSPFGMGMVKNEAFVIPQYEQEHQSQNCEDHVLEATLRTAYSNCRRGGHQCAPLTRVSGLEEKPHEYSTEISAQSWPPPCVRVEILWMRSSPPVSPAGSENSPP